MKKGMKRLLALVVALCLSCSLLPVTRAAGESFRFYYEFDKASYQVGDTVQVKVMLQRTDSNASFHLYSYSLHALFQDSNLKFVKGEAVLSDQFRITDTPTKWNNTGYDYVVLSYNGLGNHIANCAATTQIATLTFQAKANGNVVMDMLNPSIEIEPGSTITPTGSVGKTTIGDASAATYGITFTRGAAPANAAETDPTQEAQAAGASIRLPANPYTWADHTFLGWNDGTKTYAADDAYLMPDRAVTFTAQWQAETFAVTFSGGSTGDVTGTPPAATQWKYGAKNAMPSQGSLARSGYTFQGWSYGGKTYAPGELFQWDDHTGTSVAFTAAWKQNSDSGTGSGGTGSGGTGSGGGVTTKYAVNVTAPANGTVTADKKTAAAGETVTLTVTPTAGYQVGTVTVKDKNGNSITTTAKNGTYSFQMPSSAVSVGVSFAQSGTSSGGVGDCPKDSTCPVDPFQDTSNTAWWHDGIHYCVQKGLMNGVASAQFAPNGTTTRAMIVTILWRMEGSPATSYRMSFADVPAGQWYTEAIRWAQSTGVVTGYDAKTFGPNDNVTREQLAAILYRYTAHKGGDVSQRSTLAQFTDASQISSWALENIQWANAVGMVNGRTDTTLVPKGNATRAEAASMIQRFCQNVLKL